VDGVPGIVLIGGTVGLENPEHQGVLLIGGLVLPSAAVAGQGIAGAAAAATAATAATSRSAGGIQ